MLRYHLTNVLVFSLLILSSTLPAQGFNPGQTCGNGAAGTQDEFVRHLGTGAAAMTFFTIDAIALPANGSWSYRYDGLSGGDCSSNSFSAASRGATVTVDGNLQLEFISTFGDREVIVKSSGPLAAKEHNVTLQYSQGSNRWVKNFRLIVRNPLQLVFALDRSGSMECDTDETVAGNFPACAASNPGTGDGRRWDVLRDAIDNFVVSIDDNHTVGGDRMAVVYFDGDASTPGRPLQTLGTFRLGIGPELTAMGNEPALGRNGTSIGAGLFEAFDDRLGTEDATKRQLVVLFTDGEQNKGPWLTASGPQTGRAISPTSTGGTPLIDLDPGGGWDNVGLFTVGVIESGPTPMILSQAASKNTFFENVVAGDEGTFGALLAGTVYSEIFSASSPRFIDKQTYPLGANSQSVRTDFIANRNVNRMLFQLHFNNPIARRSKLSLLKDGKPVGIGRYVKVSDYSINVVLPLYDLPELDSEGTWTTVLTPPPGSRIPPGTSVSVIGMADDHAVRFEAGTVEKDLVVGKAFTPTLELSEEGRPVADATVTLSVTRPGADLNDLLARTDVTRLPVADLETGTCSNQKFDYLRQNQPEALQNYYATKKSQITFKSRGNGRYQGDFSSPDVTGLYRLRYTISYDSPRFGKVRRVVEQTRYVNFPTPDLNLTVRAVKGEELQGGFNVTTAAPSYRVNGKTRLVGPGYAMSFGVSTQAVRLTTTDNCDGSYQLRVTGPPGEKFKLYLLNNEVFEGTVKQFNADEKASKTYLSLSGGRTLPQGDFDRRFDEGIYGQIGFGRRFGSLLGLELVGGYYGFEPDFSIIGGTAYLNAYLGGGGATSLMIGAGPGYYFPEGGDARLGGSARAALERRFGGFSLGVEGGYFRLTDPEIDFATIGLRATIGL